MDMPLSSIFFEGIVIIFAINDRFILLATPIRVLLHCTVLLEYSEYKLRCKHIHTVIFKDISLGHYIVFSTTTTTHT